MFFLLGYEERFVSSFFNNGYCQLSRAPDLAADLVILKVRVGLANRWRGNAVR